MFSTGCFGLFYIILLFQSFKGFFISWSCRSVSSSWVFNSSTAVSYSFSSLKHNSDTLILNCLLEVSRVLLISAKLETLASFSAVGDSPANLVQIHCFSSVETARATFSYALIVSAIFSSVHFPQETLRLL